jgi:23S rRNA (cytosine1962-C5)-methyltransferase
MARTDLPLVTLSSKGAARLAGGHPWVFRSDIAQAPNTPPGLVRLQDTRQRPLGTALWSPASEIRVRRLEADPERTVDAGWWHDAIARAGARRRPLGAHTDAWRVVHGEGDGLPSLVVDRYADVLVVQLLSAGIETQRAHIVDALRALERPEGILARNDAAVRAREGLSRTTEPLLGHVPESVEFREHGVRMLAAPHTGQKTGAFLDQRDNRALVGSLARGRALDVFSYHGSFAQHLARGADSVTAVDVSADALARGAENAALNGHAHVTTVVADAFDWLREARTRGDRFDTIVIDPPAFAKSRAALPQAMRGYADVFRLGLLLLAEGGTLFAASCSHHLGLPDFLDVLEHAAADSGRRVTLRQLTTQPLDHPIVLTIPETQYLKGALLTVD